MDVRKKRSLIVIDPGMDLPVGHHLSASSEIALSARELGFECTILTSEKCNPADFRHLGCEVLPTFSIGPYLLSEEREQELASYLARDTELSAQYRASVIPDGAYVLMHTSSPWHLKALAERLKNARCNKVAIGLMLSMSYWTKDPAVATVLESMTRRALSDMERYGCFAYSEVGDTAGIGTLVLPLSDQTLRRLQEVDGLGTHRGADREVRMGYFGQPRPPKGFNRLINVLNRDLGDDKRRIVVEFFLPPGFAELTRQINQISPVAHASSSFRDNSRYLADMMSVDVVLCFYDPDLYASQMSGIVTEAATLGKAALVVHGTALQRFLDRYSPGSYCAVDFSDDALVAALMQPSEIWRQRQQRALASRGVLRELRRGKRFFGAAFGCFEPEVE